MSLNAYIPQENGNLKHVGEAEAEMDQLGEFIEAVQDELRGSAKDGPFVVMDIDTGQVTYVEFEDTEVVQVTRVMKVGGEIVNNGAVEAAPAEPAPTKRRAKPGPKPGTARKTGARKTAAKTTAAKRTVRKAAPKAAAKTTKVKRSGSGFKRNAASAE